MTDNPISRAAEVYRAATINPTVNAGLLGALAFGAGTSGWNQLIDTSRSLFRRPVSWLTDMTPQEFDEELEDIRNDKKLRYIIPGALGAGVMGLSLLTSYRPNEEHGGLLSWNAKAKPLDTSYDRGYQMPGTPRTHTPMKKVSKLMKLANDMFEYGGFVPQIDFSQVIDAPNTKQQLFSNDPWMQNDPFTRNTGIAIFNDAQKRSGSSNISMGTLYDTAADKFKSKFSLMGVTGIAAKTMFANAAANLLVNAVGTMVGIPQETRENLVSAGTWYQAAKSILT